MVLSNLVDAIVGGFGCYLIDGLALGCCCAELSLVLGVAGKHQLVCNCKVGFAMIVQGIAGEARSDWCLFRPC